MIAVATPSGSLVIDVKEESNERNQLVQRSTKAAQTSRSQEPTELWTRVRPARVEATRFGGGATLLSKHKMRKSTPQRLTLRLQRLPVLTHFRTSPEFDPPGHRVCFIAS